MKKISLLFLSAILISCLYGQQKPEGLFINSKAPEFKLKDQLGEEISLKEMRKKGPVVIVFYRGNWCPYCNKHLRRLQDSLQFIKDKGAQLVAITPEKEEGIKLTIEKTNASFPIVHDEGLKMMKAYDVAFSVDEITAGRYKNAGIDLAATNEKLNPNILPVPAVYIVNKEGTIIFRFFDTDYRKGVAVKEILQNLN